MQWHLKELIGRYESRNPGDPLTYRRMQDETGISTTAIHRIAANKATRADLETVDTLLTYFEKKLGERLELTDLLQRVRPGEKAT